MACGCGTWASTHCASAECAECHRMFSSIFFLLPLIIFWRNNSASRIPLNVCCFVTLCKHFGSPSSSVWVPPKYFGICDASTCSSIFGNHFFESCLKIRIFPNVYSSKKRFTILKTMANTFGTKREKATTSTTFQFRFYGVIFALSFWFFMQFY